MSQTPHQQSQRQNVVILSNSVSVVVQLDRISDTVVKHYVVSYYILSHVTCV